MKFSFFLIYLALLVVFALGVVYGADVNVGWIASVVSPDGSNKPDTYRLYRRTSNTSLALLAEFSAYVNGQPLTKTIDTTAVAGTKYYYALSAHNAAGESPLTPEGAIVATDGGMVALDIPTGRSGLISRRFGDTSTIVSILVNKSDTVAVNDSTKAATATVTVNTPADKTVLVSYRTSDGSTLIPMLVNQNQVLMINGSKQP
jgi:hypothetical protein